jgi:hypothetical protein
MTLDQAKSHFSDMLQKLRNMEPSPWPFLCSAAMLEYLAKMAIGDGRQCYIEFVRRYLGSKYSDYTFADGRKDLPEQLYHILRCGIVHSFSLTPDLNQYHNGRNESIVIAHKGRHLTKYPTTDAHHKDAVWLVFLDFADDIQSAIAGIFSKAASDLNLKNRIEQHLTRKPPIAALPIPPAGGTPEGYSSASTTTSFAVLCLSPTQASGSVHP